MCPPRWARCSRQCRGETPVSGRYKTSVRHRSIMSTGCATRHKYSAQRPLPRVFSARGVSAVAVAMALPPGYHASVRSLSRSWRFTALRILGLVVTGVRVSGVSSHGGIPPRRLVVISSSPSQGELQGMSNKTAGLRVPTG